MVVYTNEKDLQWHKLPDKGLEVALVAHADPGETHGEKVGLSRAFDLAEKFGATPIDHTLSYELMTRYPKQLESIMGIAGSNHTWLSTTLCIYAGDEQINVKKNIDRMLPKSFGYLEESAGRMDNLVLPSREKTYEVLEAYEKSSWFPHNLYSIIDNILWKTETKIEELQINHNLPYISIPQLPNKFAHRFEPFEGKNQGPFLYVDVPSNQRNKLHVVEYPNYSLNKKDSMVKVEVDWEKTKVISNNELMFNEDHYHIKNSKLLPNFLNDGFQETTTSFYNPTLGFVAPAEGYGRYRQEKAHNEGQNFWTISTRGEAVIIQRPLNKEIIKL